MLHTEIYKRYNLIFNIGKVNQWWQNGLNSIRLEYANRRQAIFTYHSETEWKLETVDSFLNKLNK